MDRGRLREAPTPRPVFSICSTKDMPGSVPGAEREQGPRNPAPGVARSGFYSAGRRARAQEAVSGHAMNGRDSMEVAPGGCPGHSRLPGRAMRLMQDTQRHNPGKNCSAEGPCRVESSRGQWYGPWRLPKRPIPQNRMLVRWRDTQLTTRIPQGRRQRQAQLNTLGSSPVGCREQHLGALSLG